MLLVTIPCRVLVQEIANQPVADSWKNCGLRLDSILGDNGDNESVHNSHHPQSDEVDQLLRNAELRDELERYFDESISRVNVQHFSLAAEN